MSRIHASWDEMKIEHWAPQGDPASAALQLEWTNLLGACLGAQGAPFEQQTCDTRKGERRIRINPLDPHCDSSIRYKTNGEITSGDLAIQADLDDSLNLNVAVLRNNRRAELDALIQSLRLLRPKGDWSRAFIESQVRALETPRGGMLRAYVGVLVWWLRQRLARMP